MSPQKNRSNADKGKDLSLVKNGESSTQYDFGGLSGELGGHAQALGQVYDIVGSMAATIKQYQKEVGIVGEQYGRMQEKDEEIHALKASLRMLNNDSKAEREELEQENERVLQLTEECEEKRKEIEEEKERMIAREEQRRADYEKRLEQMESQKQAAFEKKYQERKKALEKESDKHIKSLDAEISRLVKSGDQIQKQSTQKEKESVTEKANLVREIDTLKRSEGKLVDENLALKHELSEIKQDFAFDQAQADEYITSRFNEIDQKIQALSVKYFRELPEGILQNPKPVQDCLTNLHPSLSCVPILHSKSSKIFRLAAAQYLIMKSIRALIWQPFHCGSIATSPDIVALFAAISTRLAKQSQRKESGWRALQILGMEPEAPKVENFQNRVVADILLDLQPFIGGRTIPNLRQDLMAVIRVASEIWLETQRDTTRIYLDTGLDPLSATAANSDADAEAGTLTSLPLFPKVMRKAEGVVKELYPGKPFPSDPALLEEARKDGAAFKAHMEKALIAAAQSMKPTSSAPDRVDSPFSSPILG